MRVLAIGASNNQHSINRTLATYTAGLVDDAFVDTLDINDFELPLFSDEREELLGQPPEARAFYEKITNADAIVISYAEHNGSYTAAYKNLFDWASRINTKVFQNKPAVYLSTSPGPGGAANVLAAAVESAPTFGADLVASVSVPGFQNNFDSDSGQMTNSDIRGELQAAAQQLRDRIVVENL